MSVLEWGADWEAELEQWLAPFLDALGPRSERRHWTPLYVQGLLGPADRKSIAPMAERVAPGAQDQLNHFVAVSPWSTVPLEAQLAERAQEMVGGPNAVLIIDDTTLLKQGRHSVGVARQYSGAAGKKANCQTLVSLTLARDEVPVPVALRLFLPAEWTADPERCQRAGVPEGRITPRTKMEIAVEELDRVRGAGVEFGCVLADAGYGMSAEFRRALSDRGLLWAVGIPRTPKVYPADVAILPPPPKKKHGRPSKHPVPSAEPEGADAVLGGAEWQEISWRMGTKGPLRGRFAAVRIRVGDGPAVSGNRHLPGEEAWLVGEQRTTGERKYYLGNHPAEVPLLALAAAIKARWSCEQAHQQLKEELGLDHFEGRRWSGLHHHAVLTLVAFGFLQHLRLQEANARRAAARARGKNAPQTPGPPPQPTLPTVRRWLVTLLQGQSLQRCPHCHKLLPPDST